MKRIVINFICIVIILTGIFAITNQEKVFNIIARDYLYKHDIKIPDSNDYRRDYDFAYAKKTNNFTPKNKQDIINIIYTTLDNGWSEFSFFCDKDYKSCTKDVTNIFDDSSITSNLNNMVSPYNSYSKLGVSINSFDKVTITVTKLYTDDVIKLLNDKMDEIEKKVITDNMDTRSKITAIHDYIINNTVYDQKRATGILNGNDPDPSSFSHTAFGALYDGSAICGGYSDAMALFLDRYGVKNYKIANNEHIWNGVYLDNNWYHLDLTWDDPVTNTGENILTHQFLLINDDELVKKEVNQHSYDKNVYIEYKK
jgi:transglutaminase/protease-like cytokinesis protein 3